MGVVYLTPNKRKDRFGEFAWKIKAGQEGKPGADIVLTDGWDKHHIVSIKFPKKVPLYSPNATTSASSLRVHRLIVDPLTAAFAELMEAGLWSRVVSYSGAFNPRLIRGSKTNLSNHSWGTAIDFNTYSIPGRKHPLNGLGVAHQPLGEEASVVELVNVMARHGFFWGGLFPNQDGMHFEAGTPDKHVLLPFPNELYIDGVLARHVTTVVQGGNSVAMDDMLLRAMGKPIAMGTKPKRVAVRAFLKSHGVEIERVDDADRRLLRIFAITQ